MTGLPQVPCPASVTGHQALPAYEAVCVHMGGYV